MLDWTDRHCRYFLRLLSQHTLLYTENGDHRGDLFTVKATIWPTAKKSTGCPAAWRVAIRLSSRTVRSWRRRAAYDEINLNVWLPVLTAYRTACFGACLMGNAQFGGGLALKAMRDVVVDPVTVKTRIASMTRTATNSSAILSTRFPARRVRDVYAHPCA
ncbi:tRNA-dihydrouridine synthase A [Kluyvera cryocrescens]|uniref:tRNA-dihydrouridine synthase A n=1 Tax=Kluyvera cryocrescens TaxID=580 RepID=A0A485B794_KLUCR|nr:tRNA-dihydrouridine synthase A [Kluyvera cryocrescens]